MLLNTNTITNNPPQIKNTFTTPKKTIHHNTKQNNYQVPIKNRFQPLQPPIETVNESSIEEENERNNAPLRS